MLSLDAITVTLNGSTIIHGVSFTAERGAITVLAGPNGAGKTTLLKAAAGLLPSQGRITFDGGDLGKLTPAARAKSTGYIAQAQSAHWPMSVFNIAALGRLPHRLSSAGISAEDRQIIGETLESTGLSAFSQRRIDTLSQGEQARVMIARALCQRAPCLLADEPAAALDPYHQLQCLELLRGEAGRGTAVVIVLHNLALAWQFANHVVLLADGSVSAAGTPAQVLTPARLESVYRIRPASAAASSPFGTAWERSG